MNQPTGGRHVLRPTWLVAAQLSVTAVCCGLYVADISPVLSGLCFVLTGVTTACSMLVGPRVNRSAERRTWWGLLVVCLLFAVGPTVRPGVDGAHGLAVALPDLFLLPGYLVAIGVVSRLLRLRGARHPDAVLDVSVVTVAGAVLSVSFMVAPMLDTSRLSRWTAVLVSVYPVLDVTLLALLAMLVFTAGRRNTSLLLLAGSIGCLLIGDIGYNLLARQGQLTASPVHDAPFFVAFGLLGACALHPSMRFIGVDDGEPVQAWSWKRLVVLVPALCVPSVLIVPDSDLPLWVRFLQAGGTAALVVAVFVRASRAVGEQTRSRRVYQHLATHDALTGLVNRTAMHDRLDHLVSTGESVNVLFLDLDSFKLVNDSWGHAVGDELLVQVADRMTRQLPPDVLKSRAGGDEFVLVVPSRRHDPEAMVFAEHVIAELSQPYTLSIGEVVVTPSIGIAATETSVDRTAQALVRDADTAMYRAKDAGRGRAVAFHPSMGEVVRVRVELDRALRQALGRGEMDVAFQPIVELVSGRVVGFEALARWQRPDGGPSTPDVFIAAAEENGLILPIGDFVLGRALDELRRWRNATPWDLSVNVNVSARQLEDPGFAERVLDALEQRGLPSSALCLEVTESTLVGDDATAAAALRDLERAGVSAAVDDFGTGYSSLSYLSRLRVQSVKVDRSFVAGLTTRPEDHAIVRATTAMAQALGLGVVAEGIETREQRDALAELGVGRGQGWWLGRPGTADQALELLSRAWEPGQAEGALPPGQRPPSP